ILLKCGANATRVYQGGQTLLHRVAAKGNVSIMRRLLVLGDVDTDPKDHLGLTPLHVACTENSRWKVQLLLRMGASASIRTSDGRLPEDLFGDG
ncbi:unnamed protein product, partial [Choristocarpus tenellus]